MRRLLLKNQKENCNINRTIKRCSSEKYILLFLCVAFSALSLLLTENEFFEDEWYFESIADGLFGRDNISLMTLSSNFIITGIVYLLSRTGIRLFWYSILLVVLNLASSVVACLVISKFVSGRKKYLVCTAFLFLIGIYTTFTMQSTVVAVYSASAGCLWLFYSIERGTSKRSYVLAMVLILLGTSIRIESVAFPLAFMSVVWIWKIVRLSSEKRSKLSDNFKRYFIPFATALTLILLIEVTQQTLMEFENPGFKEWNVTRALVDDYEIPDYDEYIEEYQEIGLSRTDYNLERAYINYDPEVFTQSVYENLKEIKDSYYEKRDETAFGIGMVPDVFYRMTGSISLACGVIIVICAFLLVGPWAGSCCLALLSVAGILHLYFTIAGRLIHRIEYSIWIGMILAMIAALLLLRVGDAKKHSTRVKNTLIVFACIFLMLFRPNAIQTSAYEPNVGMSIYDIYKIHYYNPNTFGRYLVNKVSEKRTVDHSTYDEVADLYIAEHKNNLFFVALNSSWIQNFPLVGRNILQAAPVGAAENWCFMGGYQMYLKPAKQMLAKWNIDNPFRAMIRDDVRMMSKNSETYKMARLVNEYIKEHYYEDANFSIEAVVNQSTVGRFMRNFDKGGMINCPGSLAMEYSYYSWYDGMSQITLSNFQIDNFILSRDPAYVEITSPEGETYTCTTMDNGDGSLTVMLYNDIIQEGKAYSVRFIYEHYGQYFYFDAGTL